LLHTLALTFGFSLILTNENARVYKRDKAKEEDESNDSEDDYDCMKKF
jgi:hypothetical protein